MGEEKVCPKCNKKMGLIWMGRPAPGYGYEEVCDICQVQEKQEQAASVKKSVTGG